MSKIGIGIRDWADWIVASGDFGNARAYIRSLGFHKTGWRPAVIAVRAIMERTRNEAQANQASLLLEEFMPPTPAWAMGAMASLRRLQKNTYRRLGSAWGVERNIIWEISQTPEGRAYLKSLRTKGSQNKAPRTTKD